MAFTVINTQEEFDAAVKDRLARERAKFADYDDLKSQVTSLTQAKSSLEASLSQAKSQSDTLQQSLNEANGKIHGHELKAWKMAAAIKNGIPMDMADRLAGDDEASIESDAEALAKFFKQSQVPPLRNNDSVIPDDETAALKEMLKNL